MKELSLHILDILQNSIVVGSTLIELEITESAIKDTYAILIRDNGKGMSEETVQRVVDPFYTTRTTRKVGLGIPLLKQNCELTGGYLTLESELGKGTTLTAVFKYHHFDRPPAGDLAGTFALTVSAHPGIDFLYIHTTDSGTYAFDTREIKQALDGVPINDPEITLFLKDMIRENLHEIKVSM